MSDKHDGKTQKFDARYLTIRCSLCHAPAGRDCKDKQCEMYADRRIHQVRQRAYTERKRVAIK